MKLRELLLASLARPQAIGAPLARLRGRAPEGDLRRFVGWLRVGTALAPTRP
jgi:hypothetical protein